MPDSQLIEATKKILEVAKTTCDTKGWNSWDCQSAMAWLYHMMEASNPIYYAVYFYWPLLLIGFLLGFVAAVFYFKRSVQTEAKN